MPKAVVLNVTMSPVQVITDLHEAYIYNADTNTVTIDRSGTSVTGTIPSINPEIISVPELNTSIVVPDVFFVANDDGTLPPSTSNGLTSIFISDNGSYYQEITTVNGVQSIGIEHRFIDTNTTIYASIESATYSLVDIESLSSSSNPLTLGAFVGFSEVPVTQTDASVIYAPDGSVLSTGNFEAHTNYVASYSRIVYIDASLQVLDPVETATVNLKKNGFDIIVSHASSDDIRYEDTASDATVTATVANSTSVAQAPDLSGIDLSTDQIDLLNNAFTLYTSKIDTSVGTIHWVFNPSSMVFIAPGENVQFQAVVNVSDQWGDYDSSLVTVTLNGAEFTSGIQEAAKLGGAINKFFQAVAELSDPQNSIQLFFEVEKQYETLAASLKVLGLALDTAGALAKYATEWTAANNNPEKLWEATRRFVGEVVSEATGASFDFLVGYAVKEYGLLAATWATESVGAAIAANSGAAAAAIVEGSAAFEVTSALIAAVGVVTVSAAPLAVAVAAVGLGLGAEWAYKTYLAPIVTQGVETGYTYTFPAPNQTGTLPPDQLGHTLDGYLSGATIFADADNNGVLSAGEASITTDANGNFDLIGGSGPLVATGGVDALTGLPLAVSLRAPGGSTAIPPLTTLVAALQDLGIADAHQAELKVLSAFGLSPVIGLTGLDPIEPMKTGDALSGAVFAAGVEVLDTVEMIASALAGAGADLAHTGKDAFAAIAAVINGLSAGQTLDLSDTATVAALVGAVAQTEGVALDQGLADAITSVVSACNSAFAQLVQTGTVGTALLVDGAAVALVAQGAASHALQQMVADPGQFQTTVDDYTGANLSQAISVALGHIPLQATSDDASVSANETLIVNDPTHGVFANDIDSAGSAITVTGVQAADGSGSVGQSFAGAFGTLTMNQDGTYTYVAGDVAPGGTATDRFLYTVTDALGHSDTAELDIQIAGPPIPPNTPPTATNLTQTKAYTEGDASVGLDAVVVTDPDTSDTITATLTLANPAAGALTTAGGGNYTAATGVWTVGGTLPQVNAALAAVAFTPATDNNLNTTITTDIRDAANTGPADGAITLNVTPVNDPPVATNLTQTKAYIEGDASVSLDAIVVTDPDTGDTITATLTLVNPAAGLLTTGGGGNYTAATGVWTVSGSVAQVNAALAAVAFAPTNHNDLDTTITTHIRDTTNTGPADGTIALDVAPMITSNGGGAAASVSIPEDTSTVTAVTATDPSGAAQTYSLVGGADAGDFAINPTTGVLRFVAAPDYEHPTDSDHNNQYEVTVQVSDGTLHDAQTITVSVTAVREQFLFAAPLRHVHIQKITDFQHAFDQIDLKHSIFTAAGLRGTLSAAAFFSGAAAHDPTDRIIYNPANGFLIYDSNGNHPGGAVHFATLTPHLHLTHTDFVIVA